MPAGGQFVRLDVKTLARQIGYVMGSGDPIPRALEQIGCTVTLLTENDLTHGDLGRFDAIVTGVRAFNVREDLAANMPRLLEYVRAGGTLVVQYNVLERGGPASFPLGPYPIQIGRDRVSVEDAPVKIVSIPLRRFSMFRIASPPPTGRDGSRSADCISRVPGTRSTRP